MRTVISHRPALVRYFLLCARWVHRAWVLYRWYERLESLAEVVLLYLGD